MNTPEIESHYKRIEELTISYEQRKNMGEDDRKFGTGCAVFGLFLLIVFMGTFMALAGVGAILYGAYRYMQGRGWDMDTRADYERDVYLERAKIKDLRAKLGENV